LCAAFADHVIIGNDLWREKLTNRSVARRKCTALINYPDGNVFHDKLPHREPDDRFIVSYPGSLNWHQGLDIAVRAIAEVLQNIPNIELQIFGEGGSKSELANLVRELRIESHVTLHDPVPLPDVARIMARSDLGIVPKRDDSFGGEAFSTKILEFMSVGTPVVVSGTRIDRYYFDESIVRFFMPGDAIDLKNAILYMYRHPDERTLQASRALQFARNNDWATKKKLYLGLIEHLLAPPERRPSVEA